MFVRAVVAGGFDGVVGWDIPIYLNMPLYHSWVNLVKGLELTYQLSELGVPVIALVKGNTASQIKFSLNVLQRMGFKNYALHASEYLMLMPVMFFTSMLMSLMVELMIYLLLVLCSLIPLGLFVIFLGVLKGLVLLA